MLTERMIERIYLNQVGEKPSRVAMYSAFKGGLCQLRARLKESGISIDNCGYRLGYGIVP